MAEEIRKCRMCGVTRSYPLQGPDRGEPDEIIDIVCMGCSAALERRFARPGHAEGRLTLGDVVSEAFGRSRRASFEMFDPDIRDVLPLLHDDARPALARMRRYQPVLAEALYRVGRPVCLTVPEWAEVHQVEGSFLLAGLTCDGFLIYDQADCDKVLSEPDCVNAHDYNPDGTPLTDPAI